MRYNWYRKNYRVLKLRRVALSFIDITLIWPSWERIPVSNKKITSTYTRTVSDKGGGEWRRAKRCDGQTESTYVVYNNVKWIQSRTSPDSCDNPQGWVTWVTTSAHVLLEYKYRPARALMCNVHECDSNSGLPRTIPSFAFIGDAVSPCALLSDECPTFRF